MAGQTINVSVMADTRNFTQKMKGVGSDLQRVGRQFQTVGRGLTNWITKPALGVAAAATGIVAAFGWKRLTAIDTAQAQLRGLGYESEDVNRITSQLAEDLSDGMMTMAEATFAAAGAMASGVQEGSELTRYIQTLDAAVVGSTATFEEMNLIFGRVADQGHLTRTEFDMLAQRMPGFSSVVQDAMGVSSDAMYEMLRNGEITFDDFIGLMDGFAGDMATEYANTWSGMVQNTKAWIGILGENLLGGVFEQSKDSLREFVDYLSSEPVQQWAAEVGEAIGEAFTDIVERVREAIDWWIELDTATKEVILGVGAFVIALGPLLTVIGTVISWVGKAIKIIGALKPVFAALAGPVGIAIAVIGLLVAGFIWLWNTSEGFRNFWIGVWEVVRDTALGVVEWFTETAIPALVGAWEWLTDVTGEFAEWWSEHVGPVIEAGGELIAAIWERMQEAGEALWEALEPIFTAISIAWEALWGAIQEVWEKIGPPIMQAISDAWEEMKEIAELVWESIKTAVETALAVLESVILGFTALIRGDWDGFKKHMRDAANRAWEGIKTIVGRAIEFVRDRINRVVERIKSAWRTGWDTVRTTVLNAWDRIKTGVTTKANELMDFVRSIPDRVRGFFANAKNWLLQAGRNVIQGFIDGIRNRFDSVRSTLSNLTGMLPDWKGPAHRDKNILKSAGQHVIDGFIEGLESRYDGVHRSLAGLTQSVAQTPFDPYAPAMDTPGAPGASLSDSRARQDTEQPVYLTVFLGDEKLTDRMRVVADGVIRGGTAGLRRDGRAHVGQVVRR